MITKLNDSEFTLNCLRDDVLFELEVLKGKIDDVLTSHIWFGDEMFNQRKLENKEELMRYAYGYNESRIQHEHTTDLLTVYLDQLDNVIKELNEGIKKIDRAHDEIGNGQHNDEQ